MHAPRPYGLAVYGGTLTDDDLAFIDSIAKRLTNIKKTGGLDSLKLVYDLPDGGAVIAYDMGGVFRVIATKPKIDKTDDLQADHIAHGHIPMLYSGVITRAMVRQGQGVKMTITEQTRRRMGDYKGRYKPFKRLELQRFVIDYHDRVKEFEPNPPPPIRHTQYAKQRPTWYSGSMAKVMQIVGGYGRQDLDNLPDKFWERAKTNLPDKVKKRIDDELKDKLLPAYTGYPAKNGQYQYDYKHSHTNAVGFDDAGYPWLLQINRRGVYAMPLPVIPATTTTAYREWIESVGDSEILSILDIFGGLPSGESFPANDHDFFAWQRAGVIIRVCDTADFYTHIAYSSACGWSFNTLGTDGYNTCYDYNDKGLIVGYTYNLTLRLASVKDRGWLSSPKPTLPEHQAKEVAKFLAKLMSGIDKQSSQGAAMRYKLRRMSDKELYEQIQSMGDVAADVAITALDALVMPPIASHTGQVRQVAQGALYHPAKFEYQPQIKFAEPLLNGCVSFDFSQLDDYPKPSPPPKCDTIMYAYFADDDLKVIKYFYDIKKEQVQVDTNFEPYMTVGSYYKTVTEGASQVSGHFYHSDIDDRELVAPRLTHTTIDGEDKGYDTTPFFAFDYVFAMQGMIWRNRYFTHLTKSKSYSNHGINLALCVPFFIRDGVIHANHDSKSNVQTSESLALHAVQDPTIYHMWTYDFVFNWHGGAYPPAVGRPYPKDGSPCWVEAKTYRPHPSNTFADNGDWLGDGGLPYNIAWLTRPDKKTYALNGGGGAPKIKGYHRSTYPKTEQTGYLSLAMYDIPRQIHQDVPAQGYFRSSPDRYGTLFYRDACQNKMGETQYSNVSEQVDGKRKAWGNSQFVNSVGHDKAHHFIGAINE